MTTADPSSRPTQIRWLILVLACTTSWLLYLHRYAWGQIRPFIEKDLKLDSQTLGWLDGIFMATYGLGQVPGGLAGDRFGPRLLLSALILVWSAALACLAVAAAGWQLFASRALFGLAQAPAYPVLSKVTRSWFPPSVRTTVQGAVTAAGRLGGACAGLVIVTLMIGQLGLPWWAALLAVSSQGLLLAAAFWVVVRDNPGEHPWTNDAERQEVASGELAPVAGSRPVLRWDPGNRFNLTMLLLAVFASTFADNLYLNLLPTFLQKAKQFTPEGAGTVTTLLLLGGAAGGVAAGLLSDRWARRAGRRRWSRSTLGFAGKGAAAVLLLASLGAGSGGLLVAVLLASKFFTDWTVPLVWGTITDISGRAAATVFGVVNAAGAVAGALAGPSMTAIQAAFGWEGLFVCVAGVYVVSATAWLFIDCTRRLVDEAPPPPALS
jgi:MFS family permease